MRIIPASDSCLTYALLGSIPPCTWLVMLLTYAYLPNTHAIADALAIAAFITPPYSLVAAFVKLHRLARTAAKDRRHKCLRAYLAGLFTSAAVTLAYLLNEFTK